MTFLQRVTSSQGMNALIGIRPLIDPVTGTVQVGKNGKPRTEARNIWLSFSQPDQTQVAIEKLSNEFDNVYFALASYTTSEKQPLTSYGGRTGSNAQYFRSFWMDLDCGEEKFIRHNGKGVYRSKQDALRALLQWIKQTGLPIFTFLVSSGEGYHVYWQFDRDVPKEEWRTYVTIFKHLTVKFGLNMDPTRTADAASILRPPGTVHFNSGKPVTIEKDTGVVHNWDLLKGQLESLKIHLTDPGFIAELNKKYNLPDSLGELPEWLKGDSSSSMDNLDTPKRFANIIRKQEFEQSGCAQLYNMYKDQESVPEPMWAGGLSIIKFCVDKDEWAVKFSEDYSGFDYDETMRKMDQFQGPRTCAWFNSSNPGVCTQCPHYAKLAKNPNQSPLVLGIDDNRAPVEVTGKIAQKSLTGYSVSDVEDKFIIPSIPYPFIRPPQGGIYKQETDETSGEVGELECIFPNDVYIYDRIGEGSDGQPKFWARFHSPKDGVLEMELKAGELYGGPQELMKNLAGHHVYLNNPKQAADMARYLRGQIIALQNSRAINNAPKQLGWTDRNSFVLGRTEYTISGPRQCPVNESNIATMFDRATVRTPDHENKIAQWRDVINGLYGAPDAKVYRVILACGFGTILRARFALERGGIINLYSEQSGFGKTTLTKAVASIYGDPDPFVVQAKHGATNIAFFETLSYLNSVPMVIDETGQLPLNDLMEFIHTCTSGKPKLRGSSQVNDVRATLPGWRTFVFSSSNVSLWNKVSDARLENEAYIMRVVEIPMKPLQQTKDKSYGDNLVKRLAGLNGVCAPTFIDYVVKNEAALRNEWSAMATELTEKAQLETKYRFWVDILTSAALGGAVAYRLGLIPFDPDEIKETCIKLLRMLKGIADSKVMSDTDILSEFFTQMISQTVIILSQEAFTSMNMPRDKVSIRVEKWHGIIYISQFAVNEFSRMKGFDPSRLASILMRMGAERTTVDMLANTDLSTMKAKTRAFKLDMNNDVIKSFFGDADE